MTDDLVKRLRIIGAWKTPGGPLPSEEMIKPHLTCEEAADHIEGLEYALRSIAEVPLGAEIPDRTTIWGLATYMHETATDALKEGKDEPRR
jgi:hypothetical protein